MYDSLESKEKNTSYFLCCVMLFACILGKLGYEQLFHHGEIMEKAKESWERDFTVAGLRGSILDFKRGEAGL